MRRAQRGGRAQRKSSHGEPRRPRREGRNHPQNAQKREKIHRLRGLHRFEASKSLLRGSEWLHLRSSGCSADDSCLPAVVRRVRRVNSYVVPALLAAAAVRPCELLRGARHHRIQLTDRRPERRAEKFEKALLELTRARFPFVGHGKDRRSRARHQAKSGFRLPGQP